MEVFTVAELATHLKCSESLIRKLVTNKKIPFFNVGSRILFKKETIDNWVHQQEINNNNNL